MKNHSVNTVISKNIAARLCICAVLCVVLALSSVIKRTGNKSAPVSTYLVLPDAIHAVTSITLCVHGQTSYISKVDDGSWRYGDSAEIPVEQHTVFNLLHVLSSQRTIFPLSRSAEQWYSYNLDAQHADSITLRSADDVIIAELYFGAERLGGSEICVRSGRDISSWITKNDCAPYLRSDSQFWCRMELTPFLRDDSFSDNVQYASVSFIAEQTGYVLQRQSGSAWFLAENGMLQPYDVSREYVMQWLTTISSARGNSVVTYSEIPPSVDTIAVITFMLSDGSEFVFDITRTAADVIYFQNRNESWAYTISTWTKERLIPDSSRFRQ